MSRQPGAFVFSELLNPESQVKAVSKHVKNNKPHSYLLEIGCNSWRKVVASDLKNTIKSHIGPTDSVYLNAGPLYGPYPALEHPIGLSHRYHGRYLIWKSMIHPHHWLLIAPILGHTPIIPYTPEMCWDFGTDAPLALAAGPFCRAVTWWNNDIVVKH